MNSDEQCDDLCIASRIARHRFEKVFLQKRRRSRRGRLRRLIVHFGKRSYLRADFFFFDAFFAAFFFAFLRAAM